MNGEALWWPDLAASAAVADTGEPPDDASHADRARLLAARQDGGTVFTLSRGEQLLLWSARRWRHGRFRWDQVEMEFRRLLPGGWADALLAWEEIMEQLHLYPAGRPDIGNGCRSLLSADERTLLTLVAVLQRDARTRLSSALLYGRLTPPARQRDLAGPLTALSTCLLLGGTLLPLRSPAPPETRERPSISVRSANN